MPPYRTCNECTIDCTMQGIHAQLLPEESCTIAATCAKMCAALLMFVLLSRAAAHQGPDMMMDGPCRILEV